MAAVAKGRRRSHVVLDQEDHDWLMEMYDGSIGFSAAVRAIVKAHRKRIVAMAAQQSQRVEGVVQDDIAEQFASGNLAED